MLAAIASSGTLAIPAANPRMQPLSLSAVNKCREKIGIHGNVDFPSLDKVLGEATKRIAAEGRLNMAVYVLQLLSICGGAEAAAARWYAPRGYAFRFGRSGASGIALLPKGLLLLQRGGWRHVPVENRHVLGPSSACTAVELLATRCLHAGGGCMRISPSSGGAMTGNGTGRRGWE